METSGFRTFRTSFGIAALASAAMLCGCGGGSGSGSSGSEAPSATTVVGAKVAGPLDPVQTQLSSAVFTPLSDSLSGTPLQPVVACTNAIVNGSVLDIVDTVLVTLQSTAPNASTANPQALAESLRSMVTNIVMPLEGLGGQTQGCIGADGVSLVQLQDSLHALDGTPLAPLATQLEPVLEQIVMATGTSGTAPTTLQLSTVASLVSQLDTALQSALAQIPPSAYSAPVVGGSLTTLSVALKDVDTLLTAALNYNASATGTALQNLLNHALVNTLTQVVPLQTLESSAGQPGVISGQIKTAAAQLSALVGSTVGQALDPAFNTLLSAKLTTLFSSFQTLLPTLVEQFQSALNSGTTGGTGGPLAGTPLAPVVNKITTALTQLLGGTSGSCPLASIPLLSVLCTAI